MKKFTIILFFLLFVMGVPSVFGERPSYEIIITSDKTSFNKGEQTKFYGYITGFGDTQNVKIALYTSHKIQILNLTMSNLPPATDETYGYAVFGGEANLKEQIVLGNTLLSTESIQPISATLLFPKSIDSGDYVIKAVLSYTDTDGNWYTSKDVLEFRVNTFYEQYNILVRIGVGLFLLVLSFGLGVYWDRKIKN